jgi:hypothetical protein
MKNTTGQAIYTMIFETDHAAGNTIMSHIYRKAAEKQPQMLAEVRATKEAARQEASGVLGLFDPLPRQVNGQAKYEHVPPQPPYQRQRA